MVVRASCQEELERALAAAPEGEPLILRLEPLGEKIDFTSWLEKRQIREVQAAGDVGTPSRVLAVSDLRAVRIQCIRAGIPFTFLHTGELLRLKGRVYRIPADKQREQAAFSRLSYVPGANSGAGVRYRLPEASRLRERLAGSRFRSRFRLSEKDRLYIQEKSLEEIRRQAADFVRERLSAENPRKDGRQTPMRGHPVFAAQHATACCCRECLEKWHDIPAGKTLTEEEQDYIVQVLMDWVERQL